MNKPPKWNLLIRAVLFAFFVYVCVVATVVVLSSIDYSRVDGGGRPLFARERAVWGDGGTLDYEGFGYRLTRQKRIHAVGNQSGNMYGPIMTYWLLFPLPDRENLRFVADGSQNL